MAVPQSVNTAFDVLRFNYAEENRALQELRKDESIVILPADKGNSTVVLDRQDYDRKVSALLDGNAYAKLKRDPTNQSQTQLKKLLAAIFKNHA